MAVARMKKVTIFASKELREPIFERLRDLGIFHVSSESSAPRSDSYEVPEEISGQISRLDYLKDYFSRYAPIKRSFIDGFTGKKPVLSENELNRMISQYDVSAAYRKAKDHEERLRQISDLLSGTKDEIAALSFWRNLDIPLSQVGDTGSCKSALAVFPNSAFAKLPEFMEGKPISYEVLWEERSETGVWMIAHEESGPDISSLVSSVGGRIAAFKEAYPEGLTVSEIVDSLEAKAEDLISESEDIQNEDRAMAEDMLGILGLIDFYLDKQHLSRLGAEVGRTVFTLVIEGYVKARDLEKLQTGMREFREIELTSEDPDPDDDVPVFLENHPIIAPFEVVTNIFGFPQYNEIDPTPFLAPFFWIFFGICLGDAVYGIALTIGAWWFIKSQGLKPPGDKLLRLLMYSGLATVLAGAATNSWMADMFTVFLPGTAIERTLSGIALINPIEDPLTMLVVSFAFGLFQIWVGIGVKMLSDFRNGNYAEGIWSSGSWLVFLPGLILWVVSKAGVIDGTVPTYVMAVGALMVMYGASRNQKNILLKPFSGVYGLYGIVSYFSDTLSYSRLLALGLASAIIGVVVNKVAQLAVDMVPYVGWVMLPIIMLGGHVFNLVINALGSFIHSGRLQFVEFFTKFFEGGGKPFKPLTRVSENVSVDAVD
ncbi:MAG: V-type ATP synthase subunit I [Bacillota bacterium]|jgi:V/A-type H+-transporting ATPase subunit I